MFCQLLVEKVVTFDKILYRMTRKFYFYNFMLIDLILSDSKILLSKNIFSNEIKSK